MTQNTIQYIKSDEIDGFCDLSYLGEFRYFLEDAFEFQAVELVFMDI